MRWRLLGHPLFTGSVMLLAVNDHVLKHTVPGVVTGKLSDIAGVFVVCVALAVASGRARLAAALTAVGFTAIKTVAPMASVAAPLLGGMTIQDPTDLMALLAIPPATRFVRRRMATPLPERGFTRQVLVGASGIIALLSVSATSCASGPTVDGFVVQGDVTFARIYDETYDDEGNAVPRPTWAASTDGGRTWHAAADPPTAPVSTAMQACSESLGCFRVRDERVEHRATPGRWRTSFDFTNEQRERIRQRADGDCDVAVHDWFRSVAIASRPDGDHVVVAMGSQGVLHRSPEGDWSRRAVLDRRPVPVHGPSWLLDLSLLPLAAVAVGPAVLALGRRRRSGRHGIAGLAVAVTGSVGLLIIGSSLLLYGLDYTIAGPAIAVLSVAVFIASAVVALWPARGRTPTTEGRAGRGT